MEEKHIVRSKIKKFIKESKVEECIFKDYDQCIGDIKSAHSIQNNRYLKMISKKGMLKTITTGDSNGGDFKFKSVGRKIFGVFSGFCDIHDSKLFSPIENIEYNKTAEQNFLHVYRNLAREYHAIKERHKSEKRTLNALTEGIDINLEKYKITDYNKKIQIINEYNNFIDSLNENKNVFPDSEKTDLETFTKEMGVLEKKDVITRYMAIFAQTSIMLVDLGEKIDKLSNALLNKDFGVVKTKTILFAKYYPIVCSSSFIPYHSYEKRDILEQKNNIIKPEFDDEYLSLVILPDKKTQTTIILIGYLDERIEKLKLFEELECKSTNYLKKVISFLMINYCENFAMNPDYFKKFTGNEKKDIIQGFRDSLLPYVKIKRTINFFKN